MPLLFDVWFPRGDKPWGSFARLDAKDVGYSSPSQATFALPDVAARCALTTAPDGSGDTVCRFTKFASDPGVSAGPKVQLTPGWTTSQRDPITNWAGSTDGKPNANSRRWYRFKVALDPAISWEPFSVPPGSQRVCLFQVHDTIDTSPLDFDVSPPLWLIVEPEGNGWFRWEVTSASAAQTTSSNFTVRTLCRVKLVPGQAYEFTVYAKWAYDATGAISIWQDRRLIYSETGAANCSNHDPARDGSGNFSILTCYCHDDTIDRTIYHWGLQIGDETYTTYAQFAAACGAGTELERVQMRGSA